MRKANLFLLAILPIFLFPLHADNPQYPVSIRQNKQEILERYQQSFESWQRYLNNCEETYTYRAYRQSWTNLREKTVIRVQKGTVVSRAFEQNRPDFEKVRHIIKWVEEEEELNTHPEGVAPKTINELYRECREVILAKNTSPSLHNETKEYYFLRFVTDPRNLIYECLAWNNDCRGDCWEGVRLHEIELESCQGFSREE